MLTSLVQIYPGIPSWFHNGILGINIVQGRRLHDSFALAPLKPSWKAMTVATTCRKASWTEQPHEIRYIVPSSLQIVFSDRLFNAYIQAPLPYCTLPNCKGTKESVQDCHGPGGIHSLCWTCHGRNWLLQQHLFCSVWWKSSYCRAYYSRGHRSCTMCTMWRDTHVHDCNCFFKVHSDLLHLQGNPFWKP